MTEMTDNSTLGCVTGKVISNKMDKTIVVLVVRQVRHPKYNKYIKRNTKLFAHDESNICSLGDLVLIKECKPISKKKSWHLTKLINKNREDT